MCLRVAAPRPHGARTARTGVSARTRAVTRRAAATNQHIYVLVVHRGGPYLALSLHYWYTATAPAVLMLMRLMHLMQYLAMLKNRAHRQP